MNKFQRLPRALKRNLEVQTLFNEMAIDLKPPDSYGLEEGKKIEDDSNKKG